ncbi:MAG: hypothetical protein SGJ24_12880 [Chloroflexota bacterium]|nr:hypothetical protein [Chloroflexota bacterium]
MKNQIRSMTLGAVLVVGLLALPLAAQEDAPSIGFVRFAHTAVDVGAIDIYEGDAAVPLVDDLEYGEFTRLYTLPVTGAPFVVRAGNAPADSQDVLFTTGQGATGNYTALIIAAGEAESLSFLLEPLNVIRGEINGMARIRTVNMVRGTETLDVQLASDGEIATDIGYIGLTDIDITPVTTDLTVTAPDGSIVYQQDGIAFDADQHYAIVLYGDPDDLESVMAMVIATPQETTRVQITNNTDRALDVYQRTAEEIPMLTNLQPGVTTEFMSLPSRAYTFIVKEVGSGSAGQELTAIAYQFYPARDVVLVINGSETLTFDLVSETFTPADVMDAMMDDDLMEATPEMGMMPEATSEPTPAG